MTFISIWMLQMNRNRSFFKQQLLNAISKKKKLASSPIHLIPYLFNVCLNVGASVIIESGYVVQNTERGQQYKVWYLRFIEKNKFAHVVELLSQIAEFHPFLSTHARGNNMIPTCDFWSSM